MTVIIRKLKLQKELKILMSSSFRLILLQYHRKLMRQKVPKEQSYLRTNIVDGVLVKIPVVVIAFQMTIEAL